MSKFKKYSLNPETLMYELREVSKRTIFAKATLVFLGSVALAVLYFFLYTSVLGQESPKMAILRRNNARWVSRMEVLNRRLDGYESTLKALESRNDDIYRSIFGMNEIPDELRHSGIGGLSRYDYLADAQPGSPLRSTAVRLDHLTKESYVQSKSFDEVATLSRRAGDMASCIPAIPPFSPEKGKYTLSSPFGYRNDPLSGETRYHDGQDFAMKPGTPVYTTGDGVVEYVKFSFTGYGNEVLIDHGFGYKTRYAHMSIISVAEGMKLKRGDCIGESGNSGKSTGPHLHYEVLYRDERVNPMNYLDMDMSVKEYSEMVRKRGDETKELLQQSFRTRRR
ncbi:MAG: M23 family metallopeptidase [Bacteroidales bacterium]|nr:M23 family metallopeptidase [Bacteroidales bacterium]